MRTTMLVALVLGITVLAGLFSAPTASVNAEDGQPSGGTRVSVVL